MKAFPPELFLRRFLSEPYRRFCQNFSYLACGKLRNHDGAILYIRYLYLHKSESRVAVSIPVSSFIFDSTLYEQLLWKIKSIPYCALHKLYERIYVEWASHMSVVSHGAQLPFRQEPKATALNPRVKRYLDKAEECERLAAQARAPDVKAALAEISQRWRELATQVEWWEHNRD